ncbi:MAG: NUDIX hydrolase [Streptosporangiaceae bacterium]|nr:NUDIX hydrolase [Streptosporangiaceae bacterium]MBV9858183.1 NUDIX hydrolase [Streptosporangiaceae bacterium]
MPEGCTRLRPGDGTREPGDLIRSAGAVTWRRVTGATEVLLVHRRKYDDWSLPKGKQEPGEYLPETAVREVGEETGSQVLLGRWLDSVRYLAKGAPKQVDYWSARAVGTDDSAVPNSEVDRLVWLPVAQARNRLTYPHDTGVLDDFARRPADTVPLIVLRHASAGSKEEWRGDDAERPLDDRGMAEARALARVLACSASAARVFSSAARRCMDSVRPYVALTGSDIKAEDALTLGSSSVSQTESGLTQLVRGILAAAEPTVICAHRENVPVLLTAALEALGAWPLRDPTLPKGAFRVLHAAAGTLTGTECYDLFGA